MGQLECRKTTAKQDVDGVATIDKQTLETNVVDAWFQNEGKVPWLGDGSPVILPIKRDLLMRLGRKRRVSDKIVSSVNVQACPSKELALSLGFNRHLAAKHGIDNVSWVDVMVVGVSVLIVIVLFAIAPITVACGLCSIVLNDLLHVDVFEDTTIFHGVTRSRMELAWALQGLVIVILVVTATNKPLDRVDLVVIPQWSWHLSHPSRHSRLSLQRGL